MASSNYVINHGNSEGRRLNLGSGWSWKFEEKFPPVGFASRLDEIVSPSDSTRWQHSFSSPLSESLSKKINLHQFFPLFSRFFKISQPKIFKTFHLFSVFCFRTIVKNLSREFRKRCAFSNSSKKCWLLGVRRPRDATTLDLKKCSKPYYRW